MIISHQPCPCLPLYRVTLPASQPPFLYSQAHRVSFNHLPPTWHLTRHAPSRHRRHIDNHSIFQQTYQTLSMRTFTRLAINHSRYNTRHWTRPCIRVGSLLPTPRVVGMVYRTLHRPRLSRNTSLPTPWISARHLQPKNFLLPKIACVLHRTAVLLKCQHPILSYKSRPLPFLPGSRGGAGSGACLAAETKVTFHLWTNYMSPLRIRAARHPSNGRSPRARTVVRYQKSSHLSPQHLHRRTPRR